MRNIFSALAIMLVLALAAGGSAAALEANVGLVDMNEILMVHPAMEEAQQELQQEQMRMMEDMEDMDEEEAAAEQQAMQQELQMLQEELIEQALDEAIEDIEGAAENLGYDVVLDQEGLIAGEEDLEADNITDDVMDELDLEVPEMEGMEMEIEEEED